MMKFENHVNEDVILKGSALIEESAFTQEDLEYMTDKEIISQYQILFGREEE